MPANWGKTEPGFANESEGLGASFPGNELNSHKGRELLLRITKQACVYSCLFFFYGSLLPRDIFLLSVTHLEWETVPGANRLPRPAVATEERRWLQQHLLRDDSWAPVLARAEPEPRACTETDHSGQWSSDPGGQRAILGPGMEMSLEEGKAEKSERRMT